MRVDNNQNIANIGLKKACTANDQDDVRTHESHRRLQRQAQKKKKMKCENEVKSSILIFI